ncbi:isocitrate lyase/phosphoenolpyruvate mutase family protein, partial [uncultured Microbacterium sp.]|uniref:isocitrate lyase/PEP mutase family protein n=1 Tax=uncultured Microbacterium sp. TaxID=191216 RepID=UPI00262286B5
IEDQINPKRCGHSGGVEVVEADIAVRRIRGAVQGRRDPDFVIIARTDARVSLGLEAAIERARSFVDAGADVIFPEALRTADEYRQFRQAIDVPLMINLNEFGGRVPLRQQEVRDVGYQLAIYPMTLMRLAMGAVSRGVRHILGEGTQEELLREMQSKDQLYDLLDYFGHGEFDREVIS